MGRDHWGRGIDLTQLLREAGQTEGRQRRGPREAAKRGHAQIIRMSLLRLCEFEVSRKAACEDRLELRTILAHLNIDPWLRPGLHGRDGHETNRLRDRQGRRHGQVTIEITPHERAGLKTPSTAIDRVQGL